MWWYIFSVTLIVAGLSTLLFIPPEDPSGASYAKSWLARCLCGAFLGAGLLMLKYAIEGTLL